MQNPRQRLWEQWARPTWANWNSGVGESRMWNLMEPHEARGACIKYKAKGQSLVRLSPPAFLAAITPYEHIGPFS